ncbi:S-adenosyl-L-methionine-dependent tRNA 4-demethylwyosine synthase [Apophysomyces sp. BC1034]|nr:S-adenosyl-L-methionine-dependent tRNA 4-demethylwyosine synthase [Apophysomyces sp. BC1015]KAG0175846.1 S-adenosyl-L-methionine-dependent tRNA 4-demethylwyosine synthase [Apophysomyces sp. BC1021]KAG0185310.1 S-adenosyl-L-methionine-dependent tRNA 4-demethylwyosine synthase [Apophysomyces sp. BC1034]
MSGIVNSLLYGFSSILSIGPEQPREGGQDGCACSGASSQPTDGCCKAQPAPPKPDGCCKGQSEAPKSSGCCKGQAQEEEKTQKSSGGGCCKDQVKEAAEHPAGCCGGGGNSSGPTEIASLKILFSTLTGTTRTLATELQEKLQAAEHVSIENIKVMDITEYDNDDLLTETAVCVFVLSSYNVEGPLDWFTKWLRDLRYDFRVDRDALKKLRYAVCGLGDSAYGDEFNVASANIDKWLGQLGATRIYPLGACDKNADQKAQFDEWVTQFVAELEDKRSLEFAPTNIEYDSEGEDSEETAEDVVVGSGDEMVDLEDMGRVVSKMKAAKQNRAEEEVALVNSKARPKRAIGDEPKKVEARDMVSPMLHKNLTKQGYKIVGTHSGVKICRWTKSALRGRGFCYKHAFYGIQSHLCMETTPSLACANKCVFCWRHHTNPVGTVWRWKVDDPKFILDGAMENHYKMIKQLKGVPGVKADRFQEASTIRHCALSLVGEPIFYPHINEFVTLLHERNISSFLVTNAQFPDKIADMVPVTQLYVSVDAGTKEGLKKIDRPLFRDYWERFLGSLESLSEKGQRTVYRLTLVKDHNTDEIDNYVNLIRRGKPSFIEVKGVTYCGYSGASNLTMANVPYHVEVVDFCQKVIAKLGSGYEIACEHAHSCSILIASTDFKVNGEWHTHIDYPKFFELVKSGRHFTSLDYMAKTPDWAIFGTAEAGFDPDETRFYRKNRKNVQPPVIAAS